MGQVTSWTNIKKTFPNEWVAIVNPVGDLSSPYGEISGEVLAHNRDELVFISQLKQHSASKKLVDIRYTGNILPDNPVGPMLWQISDTNS